MTASPRPDTEAEGLALAEAYDRARRAFVESASAHPLPEDVEGWHWKQYLLILDVLDTRDDLQFHIEAHGPVETATGIYKLDGNGQLTFRRQDKEDTP